ncbi:relaxase/mobilization nuclease domain-containing protein [Campylobacter suis]|uniref:Mobilization protein n=1 Tax=Campylobacter suis TaxID=2790657 RepID=A0ABN7K854_9BACT|nr:relaxase/mobilization nuclease domain-containing protein [Campylobacter suis]CAD7288285.1 hypothetical protein LMG8286_01253 [Campylobacter suis]
MLVKFLPTYTGGGLGSINYLLDERVEKGSARVLKGSEMLTRAIISEIPFKQKTCFGVLSFEEKQDQLTSSQKLQIINDFEKALLGNMQNRVNVLWVERSDKELNFIIPKIDLESGKSFNPYMAKYDQTKIDYLKRAINIEYSLTSPDDIKKQQSISASKKNEKLYNFIKALDDKLKDLAVRAEINSRDELINFLHNDGFEILRITKSSITLKDLNTNAKFRLKEGIYSSDFTLTQITPNPYQEDTTATKESLEQDKRKELEHYRDRVAKLIAKRDEHNRRKYKFFIQDELNSNQSIKQINNIGEEYDSKNDTTGASLTEKERGAIYKSINKQSHKKEGSRKTSNTITNDNTARSGQDLLIARAAEQEQRDREFANKLAREQQQNNELESAIARLERRISSQRAANERELSILKDRAKRAYSICQSKLQRYELRLSELKLTTEKFTTVLKGFGEHFRATIEKLKKDISRKVKDNWDMQM